jgi:hypothetical protein
VACEINKLIVKNCSLALREKLLGQGESDGKYVLSENFNHNEKQTYIFKVINFIDLIN